MIRILLVLILLFHVSWAYSSKAINAYAVSIADESMQVENVQGVQTTQKDYNGIVYTTIYAFGEFYHAIPHVKIGSSKGHLIKKRAIVKNGLLIGYEMVFKLVTVRSGYLEVYIGNKLFDRSLYVK